MGDAPEAFHCICLVPQESMNGEVFHGGSAGESSNTLFDALHSKEP